MTLFPFTVCIKQKPACSLAGTLGPFKLSVRTAWEIAALADVRLAPSPRQQRPAPAPRAAAASSPSRPPPRTPALQPGEGHPPLGPVFLSSGLFCSLSALPLAGPRWAGGWVSLGPCPRYPRAGARVSVQAAEPGPGELGGATCAPAAATRQNPHQEGVQVPHLLPGLALGKSL